MDFFSIISAGTLYSCYQVLLQIMPLTLCITNIKHIKNSFQYTENQNNYNHYYFIIYSFVVCYVSLLVFVVCCLVYVFCVVDDPLTFVSIFFEISFGLIVAKTFIYLSPFFTSRLFIYTNIFLYVSPTSKFMYIAYNLVVKV